MLTFIVSMRARALSQNWDYHIWLLERTLDSILAQTNPEFDVAVVCHDVPEISQAGHAAVHMLQVNFPLPKREFNDMTADKVLKISRGARWAIARGSEHVMFVDADDLVSRRLSEFVTAHSEENGWYFHTGYAHRYGERWIRKQVPHHLICGTCAIVRTDLLRFSKSSFCRGENANTLAADGHGNYLTHLTEQGAPIQALPFPGAVYVLHADATTEAPGGSNYLPVGSDARRPLWRRVLSRGRQMAMMLPSVRPITASLRREFSIPDFRNVPAAYRSHSSTF